MAQGYENLKDLTFDPTSYDPHEWFIEQEDFNICPMSDEPIDIPVTFISEYPLAHYKYAVNICCEKNIDEFYECLGTQPLKIIFTHRINDEYIKRHNFNIYPDTELTREYSIDNNILYLDTNEIQLENENVLSDDYDITKKNYENLSLEESDIQNIKQGLDDTYSDDNTDEDDESSEDDEDDEDDEEEDDEDDNDCGESDEEKLLDLETGKLEELTITY